LMIIFHAE